MEPEEMEKLKKAGEELQDAAHKMVKTRQVALWVGFLVCLGVLVWVGKSMLGGGDNG
jgi:hypothetical protein